jgi:hypothetical protein
MTPDDDDPCDPSRSADRRAPPAAASGERPPERLRQGGSGFTRRLLRSADLDEPSAAARERVRAAAERALGAPRASVSRRGLGHAASALAGAAAALLGVWLWHAPGSAPRVTPEPEPKARAAATPEALAPMPRGPAPESPAPAAPAASARELLPPCARVSVGSGGAPEIDDFEDGNARLSVLDGRSGIWKASGDGTGQQAPRPGDIAFPVRLVEPGRPSRFVLRLHAERMTAGGAGLSVDLAPGHCYDASAYAGLELSARGTGRVYLAAMMIDLMEKKWGGLCERDCYDQHSAPLDLTRGWRRYAIRWEQLEQAGWGRRLAFDPSRLLALSVSVQSADTPSELTIDDVRFIPR